jgi:hypothetical protein
MNDDDVFLRAPDARPTALGLTRKGNLAAGIAP